MNKAAYDKRKMRAFLLGSLAEAETDGFDELSFTDDRFADELSASEKDLVDAYARGELSGSELESFENYYLASSIRREKVEFANAFQTFAETKTAETTGVPVEEKPLRRPGGFFTGWNIFGNLRYTLQFGLAAAVLFFMITGGWLWSENRRLKEQASETEKRRDEIGQREQELQKQLQTGQTEKAEVETEKAGVEKELARLREKSPKQPIPVAQKKQPEQKQPEQQKKQPKRPENPLMDDVPEKPLMAGVPEKPSVVPQQPPVEPRVSVASVILAPPLRGNDQISNLSISAKTEFVDAALQLESVEFAFYRVALVDQSNRILWQSGKIKAKQTADGKTLTVRFPAKTLKSQIYSLVVSGIAANGAAEEISSYPIRVVLN